MENKTGKYFKYAIGEIILVVVGILIALLINSLYTDVKNDKLKATYTLNLINDLTKDTIQLNERVKVNEDMYLKYLDSIKKVIVNPTTTINDIKMMGKNSGLNGLRTLNTYNNNTFNILVSTGNIDLFDESIIQNIMELNRLQYVESSVSEGNRTSYFTLLNSYYQQYVSSVDNKTIRNELWKDVDPVKHATTYISALNTQRHCVNRYLELSNEVLAKTEELLKFLK